METKKSNSYGKMMILLGLLLMIPLVVIIFDKSQSEYALCFIIPGCISIIAGFFISKIELKSIFEKTYDSNKKSTMLVLFSWFYCFLLGSFPFYLSNHLTFIQSLFESVSGYTTTGLTVVLPDETPLILLAHRIMSQYVGGFGLVIMFLSVLKDSQAMALFNAEGHTDRLMPNINKTSRLIFLTYNILIIIGIIGFMLLGLTFFEALNHAVCSLFTGGFGPHNDGFAHYNNPLVNIWSVIIMIFGCINTGVLIQAIKGKTKKIFQISEIRLFFTIIVSLTLLSSLVLHFKNGFSIPQSLLIGSENIVSSLSTCGNYYIDFNNVHSSVIGMNVVCMILGGCIGSTTGGIKLGRIIIVLKALENSLISKVSSSHRILPLQQTTISGKSSITSDMIKDTLSFIGIYLIVLIIGTFLISISTDCNLWEALFEFASSIGGVGSSIGLTGPSTKPLTLIIEMVAMILGRLEIYIFITGIFFLFSRTSKIFAKNN